MSANNYRKCIKCQFHLKVIKEHSKNALKEAYGKVTPEAYQKIIEENEVVQKNELDPTLREDWEIGIFKDSFVVQYQAYCSVCRFTYECKHEHSFVEMLAITSPSEIPLNIYECALHLKKIMNQHPKMTHEEIGKRMNKDGAWVTKTLDILL